MTTIVTNGEDVRDEIRAVWTHGAQDYDEDAAHGLLTPLVEDAWLETLHRTLGDTPLKVLDVGAGTGFLSVLAAKAGHEVTGVDVAPAMLERARDRAMRWGLEVRFVEGDAMELPFESDEFDAVISRHVLWTMTDPANAFREWSRVTRAGGKVTWFDWLRHPASPINRGRRLVSALTRKVSRTPEANSSHYYDSDIIEQLPFRGLQTTAPIRALLAVLGAEGVSCQALPDLQRAEQSVLPLHERVAPANIRYVGSYPVTSTLKTAIAAGHRNYGAK